jgi:hypothetical protein
MNENFDKVELGFLVNLKILRDVLKELSIKGRRWWIASDPQDAATTRSITIGHGDPLCKDRLNTLYFQVRIVGDVVSRAPTDRLVLLFDPSSCTPEEPGFYLENGRVVQDFVEDFLCFYQPIKRALIARLQAES